MYVYLSKILPLFVLPLGIVFVLGLIGILLVKRGRRRIAVIVLAVAGLVLWVSSMPFTATRLYEHLESQYPPISLERVPQAGCMVLLGGAVAPPMGPRLDMEFTESSDRIFKALQLYRAGKAPVVIVSAGNQPWSESPWVEADLIRNFLIESGVPESAILVDGSARNTRENAVYSRNIINSIECESTLLITSAAHMPRAVAAFQSANVSVTPVSTDIRAVRSGRITATAYLPSAGALAQTTEALRELMGGVVYKWKGWN